MKSVFRISEGIILLILSALLNCACEKDEPKLTDIEGNIYRIVTIGTQEWMTENLKTMKYNDGSVIPLVKDGSAWAALTTPGYCWYNNDAVTYKATYGALYNWYTINTGKLCPIGWHIPTDTEWTTLAIFLGGDITAGGKLKESGTSHWALPNSQATNETRFTALPGGYRGFGGVFFDLGCTGCWHSASDYDLFMMLGRNMNYNYGSLGGGTGSKHDGYSVRCLKD